MEIRSAGWAEAIASYLRGDKVPVQVPMFSGATEWEDMGNTTLDKLLEGVRPFVYENERVVEPAVKQEPKKAEAEAQPEEPKESTKSSIDTERLKELYGEGWPMAKIAKELGCANQTVYNYAKKFGLK